MRLARLHADKLGPVLSRDARFPQIKLTVYTGAHGSLMVMGEVDNDEDKDELKKVVAASEPPVEVLFMVWTRAQMDRATGGANLPTPPPESPVRSTPK